MIKIYKQNMNKKNNMNYYKRKPVIANKTTEYIDLKNIDKLVPKEFLQKINFLFNKDIPKEPKTPNDLLIYRLSQLKESDMQQYFYKQAVLLQYELKQLNKFNELEFVQNDNGDSSAGHLSQIQRMALFKRKKAEGSRKGFFDISIYFYASNLFKYSSLIKITLFANSANFAIYSSSLSTLTINNFLSLKYELYETKSIHFL